MRAKSLLSFWRVSLSALVLFVAWGVQPSAQCPQPDGLDGGPCCAAANEKVRLFPKVFQDSLDICWNDCGIDAVTACRARWSPHKYLAANGTTRCGFRTSRLTLFDAAGTVKWRGNMRLLYSRTWMETNAAGLPVQVWRFLVNGDLRPTTSAGPAPCPLPPCALAFNNRVKVSGYIDYAETCIAPGGGLEIAWMLTHACDAVDHVPGFPRAGAFHPGRSYSFVGPAAGFVPAPIVATEGTGLSGFEAVRRIRYPMPGTVPFIQCEFEERFQHSLTVTPLCFCSVGIPLSPQWVLGNLNGVGTCGTGLTTTGGPFLPGFLSMGIGSWTLAGAYPGVEDLRWNVGNYDYNDPCTGIVSNEVYFGVTTLGGYAANVLDSTGVGGPLPLTFIDQANSLITGTGPTTMNRPYRSDHILNLNH